MYVYTPFWLKSLQISAHRLYFITVHRCTGRTYPCVIPGSSRSGAVVRCACSWSMSRHVLINITPCA